MGSNAKDRTDAASSDCTPSRVRLGTARRIASLGSASTGTSRHHCLVIGSPNAQGEDSISLSMQKPTPRVIRSDHGPGISPGGPPGWPVASPTDLVGADLYRRARARGMLDP